MMLSDTLSINSLGQIDDAHTYALIGSIDAHTGPALDTLLAIAESSRIHLDFREVERVNSMGLALLLKLFEQWEKRGIRVEVSNLNRMVAMLFKITGLGRFLKAEPNVKAQERPQPEIVSSVQTPSAPVQLAHKSETRGGHHGRLSFIASMQSGAQLSGWYLLNTYLQRRLQHAIHLEQLPAGHDITHESVDILFAKPFEACAMMEKREFLPLLRPMGEADEVVIVMRAEDERELSTLTSPKVVTASQGSFVYLLGRFLCDEHGLDTGDFQYAFAGNEIKALQLLLKSQADLLFMLKKTYYGLSGLTRKSTRVADESDTQFAFHLFCINSSIAELQAPLIKVLTEMSGDEQGQGVLKDIQIEGWCAPEETEVRMLREIYQRYSSSS
ncbi:MAG: PhnD/SsuA/transferrin family substrate-binding protein [Methylococcaceae bacterium]|nr:PhnD/SsuA/transferrin family substrate-binding protein [Methylococcaceae bacterium]